MDTTIKSPENCISYEEFVTVIKTVEDLYLDPKNLHLKHRNIYERLGRETLEGFFALQDDVLGGETGYIKKLCENKDIDFDTERIKSLIETEKRKGYDDHEALYNALCKKVAKVQTDCREAITKKDFGMNLGYYLEARHVKKIELAEATGVAAPTVSHWIYGDKMPKNGELEKICRLLHCEKTDLLHPIEANPYTPSKEEVNITRWRKKMFGVIKSANEMQLKQLYSIAKTLGFTQTVQGDDPDSDDVSDAK